MDTEQEEEGEGSVGVRNFLAARIQEINSLSNQISLTGVPTSKGLAFQHVPKHMRRRAVSHNPKRLPKRLQSAHCSQVEKSSGSVGKKPKRPSRKYRRRRSNLLEEYNRRQRENKWLETHIWHAKRFLMENKWGYRIPIAPTDKGYRAGYRAAKCYCVMRDISFYACLQLGGSDKEALCSIISEAFAPREVNPLSVGSEMYKKGTREGLLHFYRARCYPFNYIGKVRFQWTQEKLLHLWVHPAQKEQVIRELCSEFELVSQDKLVFSKGKGEPMEEEESDQIIVEDPKLAPKRIMNRPKWINYSTNIVLTDLEGIFNRIRFYGPLTITTFKQVLQPLSSAKLFDTNGNNPKELSWWLEYYKDKVDILEKQCEIWKQLKGLDQVPLGSVLPLTVCDPRIAIPPQKLSLDVDHEQPPQVEHEQSDPLDNLLSELRKTGYNLPLYDEHIRTRVINEKMSQQEFDKRRSELLIPGSKLVLGLEENHIPIVLVHRASCSTSGFQAGGWDLVLPAGWVMPFWIAFVYRSARVVGVRESATFEFEERSPLTSNEDGILPPDGECGVADAEIRAKALQETYFKYPPAKRSNFIKLKCPYPFLTNWKELLKFHLNDATVNVDKFYVLRIPTFLDLLQSVMSRPSEENDNVSSLLSLLAKLPHRDSCLITVRLTIFGKGSIEPGAVICIPTKDDISPRSGLDKLEEPAVDDLEAQKKRTELRTERDKLKSFMQSKRKKLRKRQRTGQSVDLTIYSTDKLEHINEAINALWLPNSIEMLQAMTRVPIGFIEFGRESYSIAKCSGLGYCTLNGLVQWINSAISCDWNPQRLSLIRNCRNSLVYRLAKLDICL